MVNAFWNHSDPFNADGEGAESFAEFINRVQGVLERLRYLEKEFVVVFSHEQFIRAALWLSFVKPTEMTSDTMKSFRCFLTSFSMKNGAILPIKFVDKENVWIGTMITSHLQEDSKEPLSSDFVSMECLETCCL